MNEDSPVQPSQKPLRLLMTADAVGGVWQYCVDLISGLTRSGAEVMLATLGPQPSADQKSKIWALTGVSLVESNYALEWMPNPWKDVDASGKWLLDIQADFRPDIVHLNGYSYANLEWRSPVVVTAHSCVYSWWKAVHGRAPGTEWAEYQRRVTGGLAASDMVTAPSRYMANAIQSEYGIDSQKIRVIHNFSSIPESASGKKQPFLLAAGRIWDQAKNFDLLIRVVPKLDWEFRLAGSDRGPDNSTTALESVRFLGALPHQELLREMRECSIFVHPALYEPFGLSVLEAANARCCLALSDIPSLRELWEGAAVFINPRDPEQWIFELNRLCHNSRTRQALGARAQEQARKYRGSAILEKYRDLYRSLLASKERTEKEVAA